MKFRSKFVAVTIMLILVISLSLNIVSAINQSVIPDRTRIP